MLKEEMPTNPYTPPDADLKNISPRPRSPMKGIFGGLTTYVVGVFGVGMLVGLGYAYFLDMSGVAPEEMVAIADKLLSTPLAILFCIIWEIAFAFLGGVVCARVSHSVNYKYGLIVAFTCSAIHALVVPGLILTIPVFAGVMLGTKMGMNKTGQAGLNL